MKTKKAKCWRWLGAGLLLVLCAAPVVGAFVFRTEPGRLWLEKRVAQALAVRVEGLRVAWPLNVAIKRVFVADPDGTWLEVRDAECRWAPLALLDGRIEIRTLRVGALDISRLPAGGEKKSTEVAPPRLPEFVAAAVTVDQLRLASEVCGFPVELSGLRGRVEGDGGGEDAVNIGIQAEAARIRLDKITRSRVAADIGFSFVRERWGLSGSLAGAGFSVSNQLEFSDDRAWPTGNLHAEVEGNSGLANELWPGLSANRVEFSWDCPARHDGFEVAQVNLSAEKVRFGEMAVATATAEAHLRRSPAQSVPAVEMDARAENFSFGAGAVTGAEFHVEGPWGAFDLSGTASGAYVKPFALDAAGRLQWGGDGQEVELKQAALNWAGAQMRLTEPLRIRMQGDQTSIQGTAKMDSFDLSSVCTGAAGALDGRVAAELRLGGTLAAPEFEGEASCRQLAARAEAWAQLPPVDGSGRFSVSGGVLRVSAEAGMAPNGSARLQVQLPAQASLIPWKLDLDRSRDLAVDLEAGLDLARLVDRTARPALGMLAGRLDANLQVRGTLSEPKFDGEVRCEGFSAQTGMLEPVPAVGGSCRYGYSNGILRVDAEVGTATNGAARLQAQMPVQVSFAPWNLRLDRGRDLEANLVADVELAALNGLDAFANGRIGGRIDLSVAHVGSISSGAVTGACVLAGGEYENYSLGTVIRKGQMKLVSSGKTLVVESGSATDGGKGRLTLSGNLHPDLSAGLPYELKIDARQMRLLRRPDAEVTMTGQLALEGTATRLRAVGDLQVDNALVNLGNLRPPPPAELEPAPVEPSSVAPARAPDHDAFALRLAIAIPGSLFVRSGMLDTAWAGNLVLAHERGEPSLSGYLEPRRGTVLLLKRPFKLDEGRIDFDGRWPPEPALRLAAVYVRSDLSARARIAGPARDPEITLTSVPPLPEDEILSRILFGANMASLTPLQAVSLASEAAKLRNVAGGGGVLDGVQAAMGVDRIEFRENGQDSAAAEVAIGKYLGDRSYVEMRRAATIDSTGSARVFLERELWPNVVLEAESGLEMRSGLGLFWRRDY